MLMDYSKLMKKQKGFFMSGATRSKDFRKDSLLKLRSALEKYQGRIIGALQKDLSKPEFEAYSAELGYVLHDIDNQVRNLGRWMKPERVKSSLINFPSKGYIKPEPYGVSLIIAPWNYPVQLLLSPLIGAMSAGNCAVLKPSEVSPNTSKVIAGMISETFPEEYIAVCEGAVKETTELLKKDFDYIFYTGSTYVGRIVMEAAAKNLTPVTLELGGKSPAIIDDNVSLDVAVRRLVWGKCINAGQTCIAPDYVYVHESMKGKLIEKIKAQIKQFYGEDVSLSRDYARIINKKHFDRLASYLDGVRIIHGGKKDREGLFFEPTLVDAGWDDRVMKEEIFGPILPILTYSDESEVIEAVNSFSKPLALYVFSNDEGFQERIISNTSSGGVCINDTISHILGDNLPFRGVGKSGMGAYHGKYSFDTFSHKRSVLKRKTWLDPGFRYPPYNISISRMKRLMRLM
ncbi:MAG: aldehyde dehydrogenase [Nanobdellota archaeon]